MFDKKYRCEKCGKRVDKLHNGGATYVIGGCYCEECSKEQDKSDLKLLEKIIKVNNY